MGFLKRMVVVALFGALAGPMASCCPPSTIQITAQLVNGECEMEADFEGQAFGLYFCALEVVFPSGNDKFPGRIYWGTETTTFPPNVEGPVKYGVVKSGNNDSSPNGNATGTVDKIGLTYPFPIIGAESLSNDPRGFQGTTIPPGTDLGDPMNPAIPMELLSEDFSQCTTPDPVTGLCPRVFQVVIATLAGTVKVPIQDFTCTPELRIYGGELPPHRGGV